MVAPGSPKNAVFSIEDVGKKYIMGEVVVDALREVSIEIEKGELLVILGASGSGKSTLLNILGGLDTPSSGTVTYQNTRLDNADDKALTQFRRRHVGFVFQFYNLIPSLTALENVQLVTDIAENAMEAAEALRIVGLDHRTHHFPSQLSGGEQQRIAIARAIAKQPDVLLCDEPTGALDYNTGKVVLDAIERVNRDLRTTTLIITHNAAIAGMADRVIHMSSGSVTSIERNAKKLHPSEMEW